MENNFTINKGKYAGEYDIATADTSFLGFIVESKTKGWYKEVTNEQLTNIQKEIVKRSPYKPKDILIVDWNNYKPSSPTGLLVEKTEQKSTHMYQVVSTRYRYKDVFDVFMVCYFNGKWSKHTKVYDSRFLQKLSAIKVDDPNSPLLEALYDTGNIRSPATDPISF